jgi:hypothetical protein
MDWNLAFRLLSSSKVADDAARFYASFIVCGQSHNWPVLAPCQSRVQLDQRAAEILADDFQFTPHNLRQSSRSALALVESGAIRWTTHATEKNRLAVAYWPEAIDKPSGVQSFDPDGYVYVAYASTGHYKIGRSVRPDERIQHFDTQMPVQVMRVHQFPADTAAEAESALHEKLSSCQVKGEWFDLSDNQVDLLKTVDRFHKDTWEVVIEEEVTLPSGEKFPKYTEAIPEGALIQDG